MDLVETRALRFVFLVGVLLAGNGRVDSADCNRNGIDDVRDIEGGGSEDCNENAVPDECDVTFPEFETRRRSFPVSEASAPLRRYSGGSSSTLRVLSERTAGKSRSKRLVIR